MECSWTLLFTCAIFFHCSVIAKIDLKGWESDIQNAHSEGKLDGLLDSDEMANILKEELQLMRKELTTMFVDELSRKKRETESYEYQVILEPLEYTHGPEVNSTFPSDEIAEQPVIFQDHILVLERDGIYKIQERKPSNESNYRNETVIITEKILLGRWDLTNTGDEFRVTASIEKHNILFILVTAKKNGFSYLFTYSPLGSGMSLRQRIRNNGIVTDARFFIFYDVLYLVITHDNEVHSITLCPIFKWIGTHLDEIHNVHTRGASSVAAIEISGYMYLAIAQSVDSAGNKEIGTQIIRMDRKSEVEKVQLLYSDFPKSLFFTKFLHEYILIIVQEKMPAIVYFFGGYDFIYLQHLDTLKGSRVKMVSVLAPDGETYILASNGTQITTFSRSSALSRLTALMFVPHPNSTYVASPFSRITGMTVKPPKFYEDGSQDDRLLFTIKLAPTAAAKSLGYRVELHTLFFEQVLKTSSTYKQPEDKLSKCLFKLQKSLADSEPSIGRLQRSNAVILRKSANMAYPGTLNSQTSVSFDSGATKAESIIVKPNVNIDDESKHSPSQILARIETGINFMEDVMRKKFEGVFLRNHTNTVTGNLDFVNGVSVDYLTTNQITTEFVNKISWQQLRTNTLRTDEGRPQFVSGNWTIDNIQSDSVKTTPEISGVNISDVLLTHTAPHETQVVKGSLEFTKDVKFNDLIIPPWKSINDIRINEIINTTAGGRTVVNRDIIAGKIYLKSGTVLDLINEVNITEWYDSVLKTNGPDQFANGTYIFDDEFDAENVIVDKINGKNWDEFLESVLIDGANQTITERASFDKLDVKHLYAETINGIRIADLLNKYSDQIIKVPVHFTNLHVTGNINHSLINGLDLSKDVVLQNKNADIFGPLNVRNLTAKNLEFAEGVLVSGIDIVKSERGRKTFVYRVKGDPNKPVVLNSIYAQDVDTERVNNIPISNFGSKYWTKSGNKNVPRKFDLSGIPITISKGFQAEEINGVAVDDYVKISSEDDSPSATTNEYINTPINFKAPVDIHGAITLSPYATINNIDIPDIVSQFVHYYDSGVVYGTKTFTHPMVARHGIRVGLINNHSVENEIVMLRNGRTSYALPDLEFNDLHVKQIYVDESTRIGGTLNGLNIEEIKENTVYNDRPAVIHSNVEFAGDVEAENLFVAGRVNNYSVSDILDRIIILDNGNVIQYLYINADVLGDLDFYGPLDIEQVNGINPKEYLSSLLNRSRDQHIHGIKTFTGEVIIDGDLICKYGTINNISLVELERHAVSKTKDQTIEGKIHFQELYAHNINTASICGIPISDFARTDSLDVEEINSPVIFTNNAEILEDVTLNGKFNGYDINTVIRNLTHIHGKRHFKNVKCSGNLTWLHDRPEVKGLSYLFKKAVRLSSEVPRTITGSVTFKAGFTAKAIQADQWLNGVDLQRILDDGVYGSQEVNFTGYNHIPILYIGKNGSLDVLETLDTDMVNKVNLTELSHNVVRRNQPGIVRGKKIFENSVKAESIFTDQINGCNVSDIAVKDDGRPIEAITLDSVEGIDNLNFNNLNLFDWREFLKNRVTMKSNQTIHGNWVINGNVTVKDFSVNTLNRLYLSDAFRKNSPRVQNVHGVKKFGNLVITGDIYADSINAYNIDHFCSIMVHKDRPETFNNTVYMHAPVEFYKDVDIDDHFNDYNLENVTSDFAGKLEHFKDYAMPSDATKRETKRLLEALEQQLHQAAVWLDYLKLAEEINLEIEYPDRVEVALVEEIARIAFSKLVPVTNGKCGLPNGCLAKSIEMIEFGNNDVTQFPRIECQNIFEVSSSYNDAAYSIVSSVNSYNTTCTSSSQGSTQIYTMTISSLSNATNSDTLIGELLTGYITDVKTFHDRGVDYVVIAQFFGTQESEIGIYAIKNHTIHKIQSIPTKGTIRIAMDHIHGRCFLGVANTLSTVPSPHIHEDPDMFDEEEIKSTTYSEMYIWSRSNFPDKEHFILLREIPTKNVVDLQFVEVYPNDHGFDRESFIAFVHSDNVVEIYKYHTDKRNFFLFQTIAFDDDYQVTSLSSFYIKSSSYLIISSKPQGLLIYQYRCIEGFKFYLQVPLLDVQDFTYFVSHEKIFFPVASSGPIVAQGKIQGPAFEHEKY